MIEQVIKMPDLGPMHEAVGNCISMFASVEFGVGMCFASMLEPAPRGHSVAVINAARSFEAKMKMIDALAAVALDETKLATWRNLSARIGRRKDVRDKLAHWMVGAYPGASSAEDMAKMKAALVPPFWSKQHMEVMWNPNGQKMKPLFLHQLVEFRSLANALTLDLFRFADEISSKDHGQNEA